MGVMVRGVRLVRGVRRVWKVREYDRSRGKEK